MLHCYAIKTKLFGKTVYWLLGEGLLCWRALMLTDLSARFTRMNEAEPKGSNPQSEGKASVILAQADTRK